MSLVIFSRLNGFDLFCTNSNTAYTWQVSHCIFEAINLDVSKGRILVGVYLQRIPGFHGFSAFTFWMDNSVVTFHEHLSSAKLQFWSKRWKEHSSKQEKFMDKEAFVWQLASFIHCWSVTTVSLTTNLFLESSHCSKPKFWSIFGVLSHCEIKISYLNISNGCNWSCIFTKEVLSVSPN